MHTTAPLCTAASDGKITIYITDDKDILQSTDWQNFKLKFQINVKNPKDYLAAGTTISSYIQDGNSNTVYAAATDLTK